VRIEGGFIQMILHWQGGDHTALNLEINGAGKHRWTVPEDTLSRPCQDNWMAREGGASRLTG